MRPSPRLRRMLLAAKQRKRARDPLRRTATEIAMIANMVEYRRRCTFQIESTPMSVPNPYVEAWKRAILLDNCPYPRDDI